MSLSFSGFAIWYLFHILTKRRKISRKRSASLMATAIVATEIFRNHQAKKETHPEFWNGYNTSFAGFSKSGNKTSVAQTHSHGKREVYGCWSMLLTMRYKSVCLPWTANRKYRCMNVSEYAGVCWIVCVCVRGNAHLYFILRCVCTNNSKFESMLICYSMYAVTVAAAAAAMDKCMQNDKCGANNPQRTLLCKKEKKRNGNCRISGHWEAKTTNQTN